jgi:hypothetical protein
MNATTTERDPRRCPFCHTHGDGCEHNFAVIDATFGTVDGPAAEVYADWPFSDPEKDLTSEEMDEFIAACRESCPVCVSYDNESGPGQSSLEYWCWSDNVKRDLSKLIAFSE